MAGAFSWSFVLFILCGCTVVGLEEAAGVAKRRQAALAMQGGGFRAVAADSGLLAGALATFARQHGARRPTLSSTGLLKRFGTLSTVSGSSWFMSELLYSKHFLNLIERMAANPRIAGLLFKTGWTELWLRATSIDVPLFDLMGHIARFLVRLLLGTSDEDTIFLARFLITTGISWNNFVRTLLNSTAGIDEKVSLGSAVNDWAAGKTWMVDHAVVMPRGDNPAFFLQKKFGLQTVRVSYWSSRISVGPTVNYQPARFSVVLGVGVNSSAPLPYIADNALPLLPHFVYEAKSTDPPMPPVVADSGSLQGRDLAHGNLERQAGMLPVIGVVSASSAFLGDAVLRGPKTAELMSHFDAQLAPWISAAEGGRAFQVADELVGELSDAGGPSVSALERLAASAVRGVVDGGFCDGTGIAEAVASGADEVVALLNSNATDSPYYAELLFNGGSHPRIPGKPAALFPVFESPSAKEFAQAFKGFHRLRHSKPTRFLDSIAVGTVTASTVRNKFWGIERGRNVTLHIISMSSTLAIGLFEDFNFYNVFTQEVTTTLMEPDNRAFVEQTVLPLFTGSPRLDSAGQAEDIFV